MVPRRPGTPRPVRETMMTRWIHASLAALAGMVALASQAQTCTTTLSPGVGQGADLTLAIENAAPDTVFCLNPGTYTPINDVNRFAAPNTFAIGNRVTLKGLGATPASVVLQGAAAADHTIYFVNYLGSKSASGAQLMNLTVQGGQGGIQVQNFVANPAGRLTDIKLKDVVITTTGATAVGFGIKLQSADRMVLDNVTITSYQTALNMLDVTDSLVINSTIRTTTVEAAAGLAVLGGSGNRFLNNTIGLPRNSAGEGYSFNGGGIVFYNTSDNRFEGNTVQGMRDDALDYTIVQSVSPVTKSLNNYIGKNDIIHTAFALQGSVLGSSGIWTNCASDGSWIYGNEVRGAAECGICVWGSRSNMVQGNLNYNNGIAGIFVSGGQEANDFCTANAGAFQQKPLNNYLQSNANYFNKNDELVVRDADNTDITRNFASPKSTLGGAAQGCTNPACQASMSLESSGTGFGTSNGFRVLANTSVDVARGLWVDHTATSGIEFYLNRTINTSNSRYSTTTTRNLDRGPTLGGNYWSQFLPAGNPSSTPFTGVFDSTSNTTGRVVDRYPYGSEHLGRGYNTSIFEPRAGSSFARGTKRTVRWDSVGCVWMDLTLNHTAGSSTLRSDLPNTGYGIVTIPEAAGLGNASITATCKDSGGTVRSSATSPTFSVTTSDLKLLSPGRDDVFNASTPVWVAWKNVNPGVLTSVVIEYSTDGGGSWSPLATVNDQNTNPLTSARVTLPATGTAYAMMRVSSGTAIDQTDGVFSVRAASGAFANVSGGRTFVQGQMERLEWSSPTDSRLVTITANGVPVATDLPDRGSFDWIVPDLGAGTLSLSITYKTIAGVQIGSTVTNASAGVTSYATTITLGNPPTIGPGQSGTLTASTNSGAGVTLTSSTAGVCTVSGTTINGLANGVCTITANAGATGNFAAALPSTVSFNIGATQSITFNAPGYLAVGTTIFVNATASSGLAVAFTSLTPGVCSISGNALTGNTLGSCIVAADQPGNGTYAAAQQVQRTLQAVAAADIPRLVNISTRMKVLTGDDVMIAGFVIGGSESKTVVIRARGPSMTAAGVPNVLADPFLQLFSGATQIAANNNWQEAANQATLQASGFAPPVASESAIYVTLSPGPYTGIVTGVGGTTGVGLVEVFEVTPPHIPLINIATRGKVLTGDDVMIAGFIIQGSGPQTVVVRARGPSLTAAGVPGVLANPKLQLFSGQTEIGNNDDWQAASNASTLQASGYAPADAAEAAIYVTLNPGAYTAIVSGVGNTTGVAIVEVFGL